MLKSQDFSEYTDEDLYWLSRIISAESQGEPLEGQIAVGNVVLNRVASDQFPNTIRAVVFDTNNGVQFEPLSNGTLYNAPTAQSVAAAKLVLSGSSTAGGQPLLLRPRPLPGHLDPPEPHLSEDHRLPPVLPVGFVDFFSSRG